MIESDKGEGEIGVRDETKERLQGNVGVRGIDGLRWRRAIGEVKRKREEGSGRIKAKGEEDYWVESDLRPVTEIVEIDEILGMGATKLGRWNPMVLEWGCRNCWMRGTSSCPHGIGDGKEHGYGYCDYAIKINLIKYKLMKSGDGMKHLRNVNIIRLQDVLTYYLGKLNRMKGEGKISGEEMILLGSLGKISGQLGERYDKAIQQDEGIRIREDKVITPGDLNMMLSRANEKKDISGDNRGS